MTTAIAIMEKAQKDVARIMEKAMKDIAKLEGASPKSKSPKASPAKEKASPKSKGDDLKSKVLDALSKSKTTGQSFYRVDDGKTVTRRGAAKTANIFYSKGKIHICGSSAAKLRAPMKELGLTASDKVTDEEKPKAKAPAKKGKKEEADEDEEAGDEAEDEEAEDEEEVEDEEADDEEADEDDE